MFIKSKETLLVYCFSVLFITLILVSCKKSTTDHNGTGAGAVISPADDAVDLADVALLINGMATKATMVQDHLPQKPTVTTQASPTVQTNGYDFNGMELGKPADLFCGAVIGGGQDADNFLVNVNYDGPDCSGQFYLKGKVVIQMPRWVDWRLADPGSFAEVFIDLNNISVTRIADNKHLTVTGLIRLYYDNQFTDTTHIARVADLDVLKSPYRYVTQLITTSEKIVLHYDDGTRVSGDMMWGRFYQYSNGQIKITQEGVISSFLPHFAAFAGTDRHDRRFFWGVDQDLIMWEHCDYKPALGKMTLYFPDGNPNQDSAAIQFGVDRHGQPASGNVGNGNACLDGYFMHFTAFSQGKKTADLLFPE